MPTCHVCENPCVSRRIGRRLYCSGACKQKAFRSRLLPARLVEVRRKNNERHKLWVLANPERAKELNKRWQAKHRERMREIARRFREAHPDHARAKMLRGYGLTVAEYESLSAAQDGVCAICRRPESTRHHGGKIRRLAVDHDHDTGAVRALLCHDCNIGMGHFRDEPDRLMAAAAYLRRHASRKTA